MIQSLIDMLKKVLGSRKAMAAIIVGLVDLAVLYAPFEIPMELRIETVKYLTLLAASFEVGQGIADFGKEKEKIAAEYNIILLDREGKRKKK